jgi:hypothetical protein
LEIQAGHLWVAFDQHFYALISQNETAGIQIGTLAQQIGDGLVRETAIAAPH